VKGEKHKAYCLLCKKVFAVSHGGLNDVKAHYKGKRHIWLQRQQQERVAGQSKESHVESQTKKIVFNEEVSGDVSCQLSVFVTSGIVFFIRVVSRPTKVTGPNVQLMS